MTEFNILEKLTQKFEELKENISNNDEMLHELYNQQKEYNDDICRINNKLMELNTKIGKYEEKKERLTTILQTTQENFEQVQHAASSLLEIMDTQE